MKSQTLYNSNSNSFLKSLFIFMLLLTMANINLKAQGIVAKKGNSFEALVQSSFADDVKPQHSFTYKNVEGRELKIEAFIPAQSAEKSPCLIFIHGGGWKAGTTKTSLKWCRYLSELGCATFTVNYRLSDEDKGIKPSTCLEDVKSAVRWVRENADRFNIDVNRIAFSGTSAGGHLAAACATVKGFNAPEDNLDTSCLPNVLLLHSPVIDNGPGGYGYDRVKAFWEDFSPVHNLHEQLPPTCMLLGDKDPLIPFESAIKVAEAVKKSGSDIEFYVFEGKGHGLFSQKESELTEPIMKIYYYWHNFLYKQDYISKPKKLKNDYKIVVSKYKL